MSEQSTTATPRPGVPQWDLADRMRKAMRTADVGVQEMADYLGVSRGAISTWINGRITPSTQTIRLWALRCGVPYEWLRTGSTEGVTMTSRPSPSGRLRMVPPLLATA